MKYALALCLAALLAACATPAPRLDFDPKANFVQLHSFAWVAEDPLYQPRDSDASLSLLNRSRVIQEIESSLAARGYVKADRRETADFTIAYGVGTRERLNATTFHDPLFRSWGWGWGWPGYGRELEVRSDTAGRVYVDILDRASGRPIWHGVAREELSESDLEAAGARLPRLVQSILSQFPPH